MRRLLHSVSVSASVFAFASAFAFALVSCATPRLPELAIDLTTELAPGADFAAIFTQLGEGEPFVEWPSPDADALRGGTRVAEYADVEPGTYRLVLELRDPDGQVLERAERMVALFDTNRRVDFRIAAGFEVALTTDYLRDFDFSAIEVAINGQAPEVAEVPTQTQLFDGAVVFTARAPDDPTVSVELTLRDEQGAAVASRSAERDVSESSRVELAIVENTRVIVGGAQPLAFFDGPSDASPSGASCLWHLGRLTCWGDAASFEEGHLQGRDVMGPTRVGGRVTRACLGSHQLGCRVDVGGELHCVHTTHRDCEPNASLGVTDCRSGELAPRVEEPVVVDAHRELQCGGILFSAHACLRDAAGGLDCWGTNALGEMGEPPSEPPFTPASAPVAPPGAPAFVAFAMGGSHTCGVDSAGGLHCWGWNGNGQVGAGADGREPVTEIAGVSAVELVDASSNSTCVVDAAGEMYCWGGNEAGAITGGGENVFAPRRVPRGDGAVELAVGTSHICVRDATGNVDCWGGNVDGQLASGDRAPTSSVVRVRLPPPGRAISIASGRSHSCAALEPASPLERPEVYCWGSNHTGELGAAGADGRTPQRVPFEGSGP